MAGRRSDSRLTDDDVRIIMIAGAERQRLRQEAEKLSDAALAEKFDVSVNTISRTLHKERRRM